MYLRIAFCLMVFQAFKANADSWTISGPNTYPNATYEVYNRMVEGSQAGYGYHAYYINVPEGFVANVLCQSKRNFRFCLVGQRGRLRG